MGDEGETVKTGKSSDEKARSREEVVVAKQSLKQQHKGANFTPTFNGVNVVVWRWRNEAHARGGAAAFPNVVRDFETWQFPPFPGFRALGHFDLNLVRVGQVV
jgi:hypothetical protein